MSKIRHIELSCGVNICRKMTNWGIVNSLLNIPFLGQDASDVISFFFKWHVGDEGLKRFKYIGKNMSMM